jgi:hypothetical protein
MVLLQTSGPSDWTSYDQGIYQAMLNYFTAVTPSYTLTVSHLASALDDVCESLGCAKIGSTFEAFVMASLATAQALVTAHLAGRPAGIGGRYVLVPL